MEKRTVAGYLAQGGGLSQQGEVLCTQGLTYLLNDADIRGAFGRYLSDRTGVDVGPDVAWLAEARQADGGRPDLEGRRTDKTPVVKIEAKLGAPLYRAQLESYGEDLGRQSAPADSLLAVLAPHHRVEEAEGFVRAVFPSSTSGPCWRFGDTRLAITILSWEDVFEIIGSAAQGAARCDVAQLHGMYRVLAGLDIVPLVSLDDLSDWDAREAEARSLINLATRQLGGPWKLLPIGTEHVHEGDLSVDYHRRYVCLATGTETPCYSVGVRRPFIGHMTPIWLRFHSNTPGFPDIRSNLLASPEHGSNVIESGGHVWLPLDPSPGVGGLVEQAKTISEVADARWGER